MTSRISLLPGCNRNFSKVLDHNGFGLVAYGARSCIFVLDLSTSPPKILDSMVLRNSHQAKILSVSFCKSESNLLLASLAEDNILKIWNLETASCIASREVKNGNHVEWLYDNTNSVVFPDIFGVVSKWNFRTNNLIKIKTCSESSVCISSSNKNCPELLAAGHVVGSISILNVNSHVLLHKLKTHSMEITSLSWSPVSPSLLLSTSLDQSARLWKLSEDQPLKTYYIPTQRNRGGDDKKKNKYCGLCHPENPDMIIISNVRGDLGTVTFEENKPPKFSAFVVKDVDNFRTIYILMPYFIESDKSQLFLSIDHSKLSLWDLSNRKLLSCHFFISGSILDLHVSTMHPNFLAVCPGDGFLKVLNAASESSIASNIYINYRAKVMTVSWHPVEENIIAYGTDEGRVGVIDTYKKKVLYSYETHHSNSVYSLQWGPCCKLQDSKEEYFLYSCGGGHIYIHEIYKPKDKPEDFETIITLPPDSSSEADHKGFTELHWQSDYTYLAVGNWKGVVQLFDNKLNFLAQFLLQMKHIESLRWHPLCTYASPNGSNYSSWLAAAGNDNNIHIIDTADSLKGQSESIICQSARTLVGHKKRISSICWSPHNDGYIVSASRDGTVQVWNAITVTCLAIYSNHRDLVYGVQWSYLDPDVIYSGGMDNCLRIWKISEQSQESSGKYLKVKRKPLRPREKVAIVKEVRQETLNSAQLIAEDKVEVSKESKLIEKKDIDASIASEKNVKSLFPTFYTKFSKKEESLDDIFKLTDLLSEKTDNNTENTQKIVDKVTDEESLTFGFFTDQLTALRLFETAAIRECSSGFSDERAKYLALMSCNVDRLLTEAAEKKKLSDFLLACAPRVSYGFWIEMCEKYAFQLIEEKRYMKASMYFLTCGKIHEAVNLLLNKDYILEALALSKARLPETDPLMDTVYFKAASYFSKLHLPTHEASCHLAFKQPLVAAKILYFTDNAKYIYASTYICCKFNLKDEAETYGYICMEKCLSQKDWLTCYKVIDLVESLKVYKVLARVHEFIYTQIKALKKDDGDHKLFGVMGSKPLIWESKTVEDSIPSFLSHIYDIIRQENLLPDDRESLQEIYNLLESMDMKRKKYEVATEAHVSVAICATQAILTSLLGDFDLSRRYFMRIFSTAYNIAFLPKVMFWLFLPLNLYWSSNKNSFLCESKIRDAEVFPFMVHFQDFFISLCNKFISISEYDTEGLFLQNVSSNLSVTVQQVLAVLSKKTVEDSLLLYFASHFLGELRKQAKKGWKFRCYDAVGYNNSQEQIVHQNEGLPFITDTNNGEQKVSVIECSLKRTEEFNDSSDIVDGKIGENEASSTTENNDLSGEEESLSSNTEENTCKESLENLHNEANITSVNNDCSEGNTSDLPENENIPSPENVQKENEITLSENIQEKRKNESVVVLDKSIDDKDCEISGPCLEIDHAQCWTEISLYYVVIKHFIGVVCKDEYTLLFYLHKCLEQINRAIADLARQQSTKSVIKSSEGKECLVKKFNEKSDALKNKLSIDQEQNPIENSTTQNSVGLNFLGCQSLPYSIDQSIFKFQRVLDSVDENGHVMTASDTTLITEVTGSFNQNISQAKDTSSDTVLTSEVKSAFEESMSDILKSDINLNFVEESKSGAILKPDININFNEESKSDSDIAFEKAVKLETPTISDVDYKHNAKGVENDSAMQENSSAKSSRKIQDEMNKCSADNEVQLEENIEFFCGTDKISDALSIGNAKENGICPSSSNFEISNNELNSQKIISETLQAEHEEISEQIKLLNSEKFFHPNPFDAVSSINGICCDIFQKHPCLLIKEKFHELAHEVNKWSAKFCAKDETLICTICHVKISA